MARHRVEPRGVNPPKKKEEESFITEFMIRRMDFLSWSVTVSFFTAGAMCQCVCGLFRRLQKEHPIMDV